MAKCAPQPGRIKGCAHRHGSAESADLETSVKQLVISDTADHKRFSAESRNRASSGRAAQSDRGTRGCSGGIITHRPACSVAGMISFAAAITERITVLMWLPISMPRRGRDDMISSSPLMAGEAHHHRSHPDADAFLGSCTTRGSASLH